MPLPRPNRSAAARALRTLALAVLLGLTVAACAGGTDDTTAEDPDAMTSASEATDEGASDAGVSDAEDLLVVATTSILGDVVGTLVADAGRVEVIMPPGTDPHGFQASAADAALLREADLVVANGLDLEESLLGALAAAEEEGVRVFTLADKLDPIGFQVAGADDHDDHDGEEDGHGHDGSDDDHDDHDGEDDGHDEDADGATDEAGHDHGPEDPHVWFDPVRMAEGVRLLAAELAVVDPATDAQEWERRGQAYADELLALDEELAEILAAVPAADRHLVTNHDALGYLAARYDFEVVGTVIPGSSTQAEADARGFAELVEVVEETGVPAVFAENTDATTLADQLASEVIGRGDLDLEVVRLYTDGLGEPGTGAETYPGLLRTTATLIADALS